MADELTRDDLMDHLRRCAKAYTDAVEELRNREIELTYFLTNAKNSRDVVLPRCRADVRAAWDNLTEARGKVTE
jgi:hypothetical protein